MTSEQSFRRSSRSRVIVFVGAALASLLTGPTNQRLHSVRTASGPLRPTTWTAMPTGTPSPTTIATPAPTVSALSFSPDGSHFLLSRWDGAVTVGETESGRSMRSFRVDFDDVTAVALSLDLRRAAVMSGTRGLAIYDVTSGRRLLGPLATGRTFAMTPDAGFVVLGVGGTNGLAWCGPRACGVRKAAVDEWADADALAVNGDGHKGIAVSRAGSVVLWDTSTIRPVVQPLGWHQPRLADAVVSPDGHFAISASFDATAKVWDLVNRRPGPVFRGHQRAIMAVAISPDSQRAATASLDGITKVWDIRSGRGIASLQHDEPIVAVCFAKEGRHVVIGDIVGRVRSYAIGIE